MWISLQTVILLVFFFPDQTSNYSNKDEELWRVAKKEFARRTREYLRKNPISDDLRSFIEEVKMKRRKRQDHSNMYAIKDGEVVPLEKLEESLNAEANILGTNFTVVPLIIPIPLENTITLKDSTATQYDMSDNQIGNTNRPGIDRGQGLDMSKQKTGEHVDAESGNSKTDETVAENLIDDKLKSTSESTELGRVLEDVQKLIKSQKKGKSSSKDGALCNVTGYWDSDIGGMTFNIKKTNGGSEIVMKPREPPSEEGFIPQGKWNVTARIPFQQSAQVVVTLTANKGRRVAIFLGECRICDGSETITGDWLIGRTSSGCKDQKTAHSFMSDVFRKNNVETLREAHMKKIFNLTTSTTTPEPHSSET